MGVTFTSKEQAAAQRRVNASGSNNFLNKTQAQINSYIDTQIDGAADLSALKTTLKPMLKELAEYIKIQDERLDVVEAT